VSESVFDNCTSTSSENATLLSSARLIITVLHDHLHQKQQQQHHQYSHAECSLRRHAHGRSLASLATTLSHQQPSVTGGHLQEWIGNGSLPLFNASFVLLPSKEQKVSPPSMYALKKTVRTLHVACGYRPRKIIVRQKFSRQRMETISFRDFAPGRLMHVAK
jgi:hypothetical protein